MIDVDECALELKGANENYGHAVKNARVRKIGHYGRGKCKITLIMAAEAGDPEIPNDELTTCRIRSPLLLIISITEIHKRTITSFH